MNRRFKFPMKTVCRRSLSPEPSGGSSTDDEAKKVERKFPFNIPLMRPRAPPQIFPQDVSETTDSEETDSEGTDSEETDNEETESEATDNEETKSEATDDEEKEVARESPKAPRMRARAPEPSDEDDSTNKDATSPEKLEVSPKKRRLHRRKMYTPQRFIFPEAEVNQTNAKPCNSGGSEKSHSDQRSDP